jgi:predicted amidohydrolase YtcJ
MAALGLSPSFLIGHVHFWGKAFRDRILGPERADRLDPCRSALKGGLRISLHSDYNVTPIDPLRCIQNAVLRDMAEGGGILNPDERISPMQAIKAMTIDAAWQCHLDKTCGSLERGKAADFVVLEKDPNGVVPDEIQKIAIHSTWLDGERRYAA